MPAKTSQHPRGGILPVAAQDTVETADGFLGAGFRQNRRATEQCVNVIRVKPQHGLKVWQRFFRITEIAVSAGAVEQSRHKPRSQPNGLRIRLDRQRRFTARSLCGSQCPPGVIPVRPDANGGCEVRDRLARVFQRRMTQPAQIPCFAEFRVERNRPAQDLNCLRVSPEFPMLQGNSRQRNGLLFLVRAADNQCHRDDQQNQDGEQRSGDQKRDPAMSVERCSESGSFATGRIKTMMTCVEARPLHSPFHHETLVGKLHTAMERTAGENRLIAGIVIRRITLRFDSKIRVAFDRHALREPYGLPDLTVPTVGSRMCPPCLEIAQSAISENLLRSCHGDENRETLSAGA